ncbi:MAG: hypothetical protein IPJ65_29010 [Archangiaceae bacterium]|nr:hypothetical protein [Archangiaceae bacterium]
MSLRTSWRWVLVVCVGGLGCGIEQPDEDGLGGDDLEADALGSLTAAQKAQAIAVMRDRLLDFELSSYGTPAQREATARRLFSLAQQRLAKLDPDTGEFSDDVDANGNVTRRHGCRALLARHGVGTDGSKNEKNNVGSCLEAQYLMAADLLASSLRPPATFADPVGDPQRFSRQLAAALKAIDSADQLTETVYARYPDIHLNNPKQTNWFFWQIGLPRGATRALFLLQMYGLTHPPTAARARATVVRIAARLGRPGLLGAEVHRLGFTKGYHYSGANLAWNTQAHQFLGLALGDAARLTEVRNAMELSAQMQWRLPGIQPDYSYRFHNPANAKGGLDLVGQLYIGGYGEAQVELLAQYMFVTDPTAFRLRDVHVAGAAKPTYEYRSNFIRLVQTGARASYRGFLDPATKGRHVSHGNFSVSGYTHAMVLLAAMKLSGTPPWQQSLRAELGVALARPEITANLGPKYRAVLAAADRSSWPALAEATFFDHYPYVDYSVLRRPDFFLAQRMLSSRMLPGELLVDGNMFGARQADGRYTLALEGGEYAQHDTGGALDWKLLPGITTLYRADSADAFKVVKGALKPQYRTNESAFAGAASDGLTGVSAFVLDALNTGLQAKKSTFFFEDAVAFLVADVRCPSCKGEVTSVVQQWPLLKAGTAGERPVTVGQASARVSLPQGREVGAPDAGRGGVPYADTRWVVADAVGYFFPGGEDLRLRIKKQLACWDLLSRQKAELPDEAAGRTLPVQPSHTRCFTSQGTRPFLTLWVDHGPGGAVSTRSTSWVVVPHATEAQMAQWQARSPLAVLRNDATAAAVSYRRADTFSVGLVAWPQAGAPRAVELAQPELGKVTLTGSAVVQLKKQGTTLGIAAAYPRLAAAKVKLTLGRGYQAGTLPECARVSSTEGLTTVSLTLGGGATCRFKLSDWGVPPPPPESATARVLSVDTTVADEPESGTDGEVEPEEAEPYGPEGDASEAP